MKTCHTCSIFWDCKQREKYEYNLKPIYEFISIIRLLHDLWEGFAEHCSRYEGRK